MESNKNINKDVVVTDNDANGFVSGSFICVDNDIFNNIDNEKSESQLSTIPLELDIEEINKLNNDNDDDNNDFIAIPKMWGVLVLLHSSILPEKSHFIISTISSSFDENKFDLNSLNQENKNNYIYSIGRGKLNNICIKVCF